MSLRGPEAEFSWPELTTYGQSVPDKYCKVWSIEGGVPCFERDHLSVGFEIAGPALICDLAATLWLKPGWGLEVSPEGHLILWR